MSDLPLDIAINTFAAFVYIVPHQRPFLSPLQTHFDYDKLALLFISGTWNGVSAIRICPYPLRWQRAISQETTANLKLVWFLAHCAQLPRASLYIARRAYQEHCKSCTTIFFCMIVPWNIYNESAWLSGTNWNALQFHKRRAEALLQWKERPRSLRISWSQRKALLTFFVFTVATKCGVTIAFSGKNSLEREFAFGCVHTAIIIMGLRINIAPAVIWHPSSR